MSGSRRAAWWWLTGFALALVAAEVKPLVMYEHQLADVLYQFGDALPQANLIWVLGGVSLTGAVTLVGSVVTRRYAWLGVFVAGVALEVLTKHWVATPLPHPTLEPDWIARLEHWTSPSAHQAMAWVSQVVGFHRGSGGAAFFRGSFFSGHVFRLTLTVGMFCGRRSWILWTVGVAAGLLVVATGGHWPLDAVGGYALARAGLTLVKARGLEQ